MANKESLLLKEPLGIHFEQYTTGIFLETFEDLLESNILKFKN